MTDFDRGYKKIVYDELSDEIGHGDERFPETIGQIAEYADRIFSGKARGEMTEHNERHLQALIEGLRLSLDLDNSNAILLALERAAETAVRIMLTIGRS